MKIIVDHEGHTGFVTVNDGHEATTIDLSDTVIASLTNDGVFIGLDIADTRQFGDPFDAAAAARALEWAAARLDLGSAS